ncbi:MAG: TrbI/VirB10 family protein [Candidatus Competibacteraceae bacterium]
MRLAAWWHRLDPRWQRWLLIGGVTAGLIAGVYPFLSQNHPPQRSGRDETIKQILTDKDPRTLGFDGLVAELKTLRSQLETTRKDLDQMQSGQPTSLQENLRRQQSDLQGAVNELRELREVVRRLEHPTPKPDVSPPPKPDVPPPTNPPATPPAPPLSPPAPPVGKALPPANRPPSAPNTLFTPPGFPGQSNLPTPGNLAGPTPTLPVAATVPKIRVVQEEMPTTMATPAGENVAVARPRPLSGGPRHEAAKGVFLPTSIISGTLLTGLDAPTGQGARSDPLPVLLRVKHEALGPNFFTVDIRECFLIAAGHGDLSAERAYLRAETLSCVRRDGGVIEAPIDAYAVGEDGKAGVGGRVVSKQGQVLARALQAGFLEAFAGLFQKQPVATLSTTDRNKTPYQSHLSVDALGSAALAGVGNALDRLAQFYIDMAEGMFPVIEISAGRPIDFVVIHGRELQLPSRR